MTFEIGIMNPAPAMTYRFRTFVGSFEDACVLADTFAEIEGRKTIVSSPNHSDNLSGGGYSSKPMYVVNP